MCDRLPSPSLDAGASLRFPAAPPLPPAGRLGIACGGGFKSV
jgi:hypothetical protein